MRVVLAAVLALSTGLVAGCAELGVVTDGSTVSFGKPNHGYLMDGVKQRSADVANQYRPLLMKLYGDQKGRAIKYAEAFELNQYGSAATADELKQMFPTFR